MAPLLVEISPGPSFSKRGILPGQIKVPLYKKGKQGDFRARKGINENVNCKKPKK